MARSSASCAARIPAGVGDPTGEGEEGDREAEEEEGGGNPLVVPTVDPKEVVVVVVVVLFWSDNECDCLSSSVCAATRSRSYCSMYAPGESDIVR